MWKSCPLIPVPDGMEPCLLLLSSLGGMVHEFLSLPAKKEA